MVCVYHERVTEEEHRNYRLAAQKQADSGILIHVPARRTWNAPLQQRGNLQPELPRKPLSYLFDVKDEQVDANDLTLPRTRTTDHEQKSVVSRDPPSNERKSESNSQIETVEDPILMRAVIDPVDDSAWLALVRTADRNCELPKLDSSGGGNLSQIEERVSTPPPCTVRPQPPLTSVYPGRVSAFKEHLSDELVSPVDDPEIWMRPRPAPASPKKSSFEFVQRLSDSTKALTKSEPTTAMKKNFRKLRLDLQRSGKALNKTESEADSADWACPTSLAIEAWRNSYSPPSVTSSRYSSTPAASNKRSVGASQASRPASGSSRSGRLEGMEIFLGEVPAMRHDNTQASPVLDVNKVLPPLPSREGITGENEGEPQWI